VNVVLQRGVLGLRLRGSNAGLKDCVRVGNSSASKVGDCVWRVELGSGEESDAESDSVSDGLGEMEGSEALGET